MKFRNFSVLCLFSLSVFLRLFLLSSSFCLYISLLLSIFDCFFDKFNQNPGKINEKNRNKKKTFQEGFNWKKTKVIYYLSTMDVLYNKYIKNHRANPQFYEWTKILWKKGAKKKRRILSIRKMKIFKFIILSKLKRSNQKLQW